MAESDDTSVMFEIGVMEHPATKSRIEALQKQILDAQAKMAQGVERVGLAAQASAAAVTPLTSKISEFRSAAMEGYDDVRGAITRLVAAAEQKIQIEVNVQGRNELEALLARIRAASNESSGGGGGGGIAPEPERIPAPDTTAVEDAFEELPASLRNVFQTLGTDAQEAADEIGDAFESRLSGLANTTALRDGFQQQMTAQVENFAAVSRELDDALDAQGQSVEMMNASLVKGIRSVIGATKGFAELGLVSSETSEQLLKGLVVIQGAFDIVDGAADLLESFTAGWKAVRQSTDAAAAASRLQQTLMGPQFALMRAYQGQLAVETAAANAAAVANERLAVSRGVGSVGGAAAGAAASGVASVGGAAVGAGGGAAAGAGGVALGPILGIIAAVAGSLAVVGMAAVQAKDAINGKAQAEKSFAMSSARMQVELVASVLQATGAFKLVNAGSSVMSTSMNDFTRKIGSSLPVVGNLVSALGFLGDAAGLAGTNVAVAKAEKQVAKNKIQSEFTERMGDVDRAGENEMNVQNFKSLAARNRSNAESVGTNDSQLAAEFKIQAEASARIAESQKALERSQSGEGTKAEGQKAAKDIEAFESEIKASQQRQTGLGVAKVDAALEAEVFLQKEATAEMEKQEGIAAKMRADGITNSKALADADAAAATFRQDALQSLQRQKELVKERADVEIQGQQRIGEMLKTQIEQKNQQLQRSKDEQTGAARNFAKLNTFEKEQSLKALEQARAKGAGSLNDRQKDLLRSVGTREAVQFANQGDDAEAAKFGFNDQNFGQGFAQEQSDIQTAKSKLEAQLSTTYDVNVTSSSNAEQIVADVTTVVNQILDNESATISAQIDAKLKEARSAVTIEMNDKLRQLKKPT